VSLLQIAEIMLKHTPEFEARESVPLYLPGSMLESDFAFPTQVGDETRATVV
jgi:hypothetical protein